LNSLLGLSLGRDYAGNVAARRWGTDLVDDNFIYTNNNELWGGVAYLFNDAANRSDF
jgi:hypothetical protein